MATKSKSYAPNGGHTSGIFASMSVDGPEIGTLVTIVDRAKNLPNRKTIGKQDPYCAARLGKEAKKTATDIRGGQTPKWDQELRFTVHDSPDYYQLKISIFTDDKKTDVVGEAWIDLKGIIVPGGGQNDMWQSLSCKGKYAGEIRVEITYYDSRPKPEKPAMKQKKPATSDRDAGSVKQGPVVPRRPLPSEPIAGETPPPPPPPAPLPAGRLVPEHDHQTPPRSLGFVPTQSPLQAGEYNVSPPHATRQHPEQYSPLPRSECLTTRVDGPRPAHRHGELFDTPPHPCEERGYSHKVPTSPCDPVDPRRQPSSEHPHEMPTGDEIRDSPPFEDGRPPTPPAHRSGNDDSKEIIRRGSYDSLPQKPTPFTPMRHDLLNHGGQTYSAPSYPGRPIFRAYDSAPPAPSPPAPLRPSPYEHAPPRYHSYNPASDAQCRSMQATVEDAPETPPGPLANPLRHHGSRMDPHYEMMFDASAPPGPLDLTRSPGRSTHMNQPHGHSTSSRQDQGQYPGSVPPLSAGDRSNGSTYHSYYGQVHSLSPRHKPEPNTIRHSQSLGLVEVPATLTPEMDTGLSQQISKQIYEERCHDTRYGPPNDKTPTRSRHRSEGPPPYGSYPSGYVYETRSDITYSGGPEDRVAQQNDLPPSPSPNVRHTIRRKSLSPAPRPAENRMLSDVPFSPDSYDALNPSMTSPRAATSTDELADSSGKIITHDGREVDPSDHLPMETWAPEPEPKPGQGQGSPEPRARPSPSGAQPMPPTGRRPLRVARPQANAVARPTSYSYGEGPCTPPAPGSGGRNRLQKKSDRASVGPWPMSSPLAPVSTDNYQDRHSSYTPSSASRHGGGGSWDYPNENQAPHHGSGPLVPAKIPFPAMTSANGTGYQAIVQEMQRIDIGSGRSRRRGGY